jgi:hypothetical protein
MNMEEGKLKAAAISLGLFGLGQWLIYGEVAVSYKLIVLLIYFMAIFLVVEINYSKIKVIIRNFLPLALLIGLISFFEFENIYLLKQAMLLMVVFCFYLFYSRLGIPQSKKIANQLTYYWLDISILVALYLLSLAIYQLVNYAQLPLYYLVVLMGLLGGLLFGYGLWARNVKPKVATVFLVLFLLITLEVFIVLSFWQEAFPLYKALILALLYYIFMGLLDIKLRGDRLIDHYLSYLIIAILVFSLIVIFVDWRVFGS